MNNSDTNIQMNISSGFSRSNFRRRICFSIQSWEIYLVFLDRVWYSLVKYKIEWTNNDRIYNTDQASLFFLRKFPMSNPLFGKDHNEKRVYTFISSNRWSHTIIISRDDFQAMKFSFYLFHIGFRHYHQDSLYLRHISKSWKYTIHLHTWIDRTGMSSVLEICWWVLVKQTNLKALQMENKLIIFLRWKRKLYQLNKIVIGLD